MNWLKTTLENRELGLTDRSATSRCSFASSSLGFIWQHYCNIYMKISKIENLRYSGQARCDEHENFISACFEVHSVICDKLARKRRVTAAFSQAVWLHYMRLTVLSIGATDSRLWKHCRPSAPVVCHHGHDFVIKINMIWLVLSCWC
jgi:hypothetical protein